MNIISLLYPTLVSFTDADVAINFFHLLFSFALKADVEFSNRWQGICQRTYVMVLLLFHVLVHTLHAHHCSLLLAVKHKGFLVCTAFDL